MASSAGLAQPWAGILDPSRAIDWSTAGVVGGIPVRTTICATLNSGATYSQINAAIAKCPANQVVFLNAGTYNLSDGIMMKANVTLRGAGADKTFLNAMGQGTSCAVICFMGENTWPGDSQVVQGAPQTADWTGGYTRGSKSITLANVGKTGIKVGQFIYLDQLNDAAPTGNYFVCDNTTTPCSIEGGNGPRLSNGVYRSLLQIVQVTGISGNTYSITPGLYGNQWSAGKSPAAWWAVNQIQRAGLEDLSIDDSQDNGGEDIVQFYNAFNCWMSGVRSINPSRSHVVYAEAAHNTVQNSYFYGTKKSRSTSYGVESYVGSDNLTVNNVFQRVTSPLMTQIATGSVFAYNYDVLDFYCDSVCNDNPAGLMGITTILHNAGVAYTLWEGNVSPGYKGDTFHGTGGLQTIFRNHLFGWAPIVRSGRMALELQSYNRAYNVVGNVLGKASFSSSYAVADKEGTIYSLGQGGGGGGVVPKDPKVVSTLLRWGNWDAVSNATRWCGSSTNTGWSSVCGGVSEVPTGIGAYANPVPVNENFPASFYYSSRPKWWPANKPWPLIGPDVTSGNVSGYAGHSNTNPAQDCFTNVMKGPVDGTGPVLNFSAVACYRTGSPSANLLPPGGISAVVR